MLKFLFIGPAWIFLSCGAFGWDAKNFTKPDKAVLKKTLTPLQYSVTQEEDTERPFKNEYWDNKKDGIYVDIVSGEPLFSSLDKYDSGTGWPSFTKPLSKDAVVEKKDSKFFTSRIEISSKFAKSHLGHVFDDGPKPTGLRYCMNSASMRFIPSDQLASQGYPEYASLFTKRESKDEKSVKVEKALLAGGCFWCMEPPFDKLKDKGVIETQVGYAGGKKDRPTYEEVSAGSSGHLEVIEVTFDPSKISYEQILDIFWSNIDPHDRNGQFCDKGEQYESAIFALNDDQKKTAEASKSKIKKSVKDEVVTKILPSAKFWPAEDYHQDYYEKNPIRYKYYRTRCGRDARLKEVWKN